MSGPQQPAPADPAPSDPTASRNSALVAAGILLSRITGLVRTAVIARFLGVGAVADAFQAAMRIPNLLQNLLGEGVLSASFIPVYSRLLAQGRQQEAGRVAGAVVGLLTALTGALALLGVLFAGPITRVVAIGFTGQTLDLAIHLTRILFPGVGFLVLSAWCLGVLNSHGRFFLSYVAPVIWNMTQVAVLVGAALLLIDGDVLSASVPTATLEQLAVALAWGVFVGGVLQVAVQIPSVLQLAGPLHPSLDVNERGVRRTLRSFWPVVTGRGVVQLMTYVDIALASLLAAGAVSALEYATRLALLPVSLFGMSAAASELPALSSLNVEERAGVARRLAPTLARIAFFVVPTIAVFVVAGDLLYDVVLLPLAARLVWLVLLGSSVGLLSNTSSRLLQSALYAVGDTRTPTRYAILRVFVAVVAGAVLMLQFDRIVLTATGFAIEGSLPAFTPLPPDLRGTDPTEALRLGAVGLALAAGASSWLEFGLLRRYLARRRGIAVQVGGGLLARTAVAGVLAGATGIGVRVLLAEQTLPVLLPATVGAIGVTYLGLAAALRLPQMADLRRMVSSRR